MQDFVIEFSFFGKDVRAKIRASSDVEAIQKFFDSLKGQVKINGLYRQEEMDALLKKFDEAVNEFSRASPQ